MFSIETYLEWSEQSDRNTECGMRFEGKRKSNALYGHYKINLDIYTKCVTNSASVSSSNFKCFALSNRQMIECL